MLLLDREFGASKPLFVTLQGALVIALVPSASGDE